MTLEAATMNRPHSSSTVRCIPVFFCIVLFLLAVCGALEALDGRARTQWARLGEDEALSPQRGSHRQQDRGQQELHYAATQLPLGKKIDAPITMPINPLEELHYALETMQTSYFELWLGTWPDAIEWTAAVMGTFVSASLNSLTRSLEYILPLYGDQDPTSAEGQRVENEINKYFSQTVAYYFEENAFAIRTQAYDDMLWVVLGWLENIRFIELHTQAHYPHSNARGGVWYGKQFEAAFAHRAHVFYDLASRGWDISLCGGGMVWNPHLEPYKNAITNQLFISASVGMYLNFPGDENTSPFLTATDKDQSNAGEPSTKGFGLNPTKPHDPSFLRAAVEAYHWLNRSNMTNALGLYVDGFHIHNWGQNHGIGTGRCDVRNEMVYTYNQGVLLSGLRGLWEGTGQLSYLSDGHKLIRNVIAATGWNLDRQTVRPGGQGWSGLGRAGILEELCDASSTCNQDGQTFKGIFFHHLTLFCEPLPRTPRVPGVTLGADPVTESMHRQSCKEYAQWVTRNARAALATRDSAGRFGMWWGNVEGAELDTPEMPTGAVDYRNRKRDADDGNKWGMPRPEPGSKFQRRNGKSEGIADERTTHAVDINDRGRGRTVETQGGGVAVLRAMWELVHMYQQD